VRGLRGGDGDERYVHAGHAQRESLEAALSTFGVGSDVTSAAERRAFIRALFTHTAPPFSVCVN
jgi:hypothetical protein